mgnify:FL=1
MKSDPRLLDQFKYFNRKFFDKRLPDSSVCWGVMKPNKDGNTPVGRLLRKKYIRYRVTGNKWIMFKTDRPVILISTLFLKYHWHGFTQQTLLHEMAHLAIPMRFYHGPRFQKEMLRLAKIGAFKGLW